MALDEYQKVEVHKCLVPVKHDFLKLYFVLFLLVLEFLYEFKLE